MGDFNLNLMNHHCHSITGEFLDALYSNMFFPLITRPTRITSHSATLIDNIFVNQFFDSSRSGLLFTDISDHLPIFFIHFDSSFSAPTETALVRDINQVNTAKFLSQLVTIDWSQFVTLDDTNNAYNSFLKQYSKIYDSCFPMKKVKVSNYRLSKPWLSKGLLKSIRTKNKLYKQYLSNQSPLYETGYKKYKNKLNHSLRIAKRLYYEKKIDAVKSNAKATWKVLNEIIKTKKKASKINAIFKVDDQEITDPVDIANRFCSYFSNIGPNLAKNIHSSASHRSFLSGNFPHSLFLDPVTSNELIEISNSFRSGKATGHDKIPISIIKQSIHIIAEPLALIINLSITQGIVPDQMKIARVIPLFKTGDRTLFTNYRPVSILPSFSKFLEKVVYNRLANYLSKHDILCNNQFGFRKNHSTSLALIDLYEKISLALDRNEHAIGVFLDLSKAFDTVDHNILLDKLEHYGIRGVALDWISNYLSHRLQFVQFNDHCSSPQTIRCGVPQGSILGPLFFLLYVNDIINVSKLAELILFADDTNLFMSHKDPSYLATSLNSELNKLSFWFKANKLSLNLKKTNFMVFKPRQKRCSFSVQIYINEQRIEQVKESVFLGVVLDEHLSWKPHISQVACKISKSIGVIYRAGFFLPNHCLKTLYYCLVYPYFHYCITVWGSTYKTNLRRLVSLQKRVVRIISNSSFDAPSDPIFKNLKLLKFFDIRQLELGKLMFSFSHSLLPVKFKDYFCFNNEVHSYDTRHTDNFHLPFCRTNLRKFSVSFQGPSYYNSLANEIKDSTSLSLFKTKLCKLIYENY